MGLKTFFRDESYKKAVNVRSILKKYNTLEIKYQAKCEELDDRVIQLNTEKRIKKKQQELFNERVEELTKEIMDLKEERAKLKKEIRELKKNGK